MERKFEEISIRSSEELMDTLFKFYKLKKDAATKGNAEKLANLLNIEKRGFVDCVTKEFIKVHRQSWPEDGL